MARPPEATGTPLMDLTYITFQAESLIGTAHAFGLDVSVAERKLTEAIEARNDDPSRAFALAEESRSIVTALVESFHPDLSLSVGFESALVQGKWSNAVMEVSNSGPARALYVRPDIAGDLRIDGLDDINMLRGGGATKQVPVRVKPTRSGEIMARVEIRCMREYDNKAFEFHDVRWLLAEDPKKGRPGAVSPVAQFFRKELACASCHGPVGAQEAPRACRCEAAFHQACAEQLEKCPNCGKSLGGA